jgi:CheY-like chemotaxis protein
MDDDTMRIAAVGLPETTKLFIKSKMSPLIIEFRTMRNAEEFPQLLGMKNPGIACVLIDSDYQEDKGLTFCRAVRKADKDLPILMLCSETDRNYYISAIRWGVSGFIMKPFKDDALKTKLIECYGTHANRSVDVISFDLDRYLLGEFRKAAKGHYSLSYMFAAALINDPEEQGNPMSQAYYLNILYETLKHQFWDTDMFIRLNNKYCFGVFPFCGKKNIETLTNKIGAAFNALYAGRSVPAYVRLATAFSTYPDDSDKFLDLQRLLADKVRMIMGDTGIEWFL